MEAVIDLLSFFGNLAEVVDPELAVIAALVKAIPFAITAYDALTVSVAEQKEKMEEVASVYEETKSELSNITAQLESQEQIIDELLSKGTLTYAEKGQLEELQAITEELRIQKDLDERNTAAAQKESAKEASDLFEKQFGKYDISEEEINKQRSSAEASGSNSALVTDKNDISYMIANYENLKKLLDEAYASNSQSEIKYFKASIEDTEERIFSTVSDLQEQQKNITDYYNIIKDTPYADLTRDQQEIVDSYNEISNAIELIYQHLDPDAWKTMQIENVFDTEGIEKTKGELTEMAEAGALNEKIIQAYPKLSDALEENKVSASELCAELQALADQEKGISNPPVDGNSAFTDALSQVESLSEGLGKLDAIYADVYDKGDFDWSSILNNKEFYDIFGGFTKEYDDFIKTISNTPDDINACQTAFNGLVTAYITNSDAMRNLSAETKDTTIKMLEQMGIANAQEIVTERLAAQEVFLTAKKNDASIASSNLVDATWLEIGAVLKEGSAVEETKSYLAQLALEKLDFSANSINTDDDVQAIIAIANAAGASSEYVGALKRALENLQQTQAAIDNLDNINTKNIPGKVTAPFLKIGLEISKQEAQKDVDQLLSDLQNGIEKNRLDPSDFYADYKGSSSTKSAKSAADKAAESAKTETGETKNETVFDWIETAVKRVEQSLSRLKQKADSVYQSWTSRNSSLKAEMSAVRSEIELQQKAYTRYMQQADSVGLSESWAAKVRNGQIDIAAITDEDLTKQIQDYQSWYEKALACQDAIDELNETVSGLYKTSFDNTATQYDNVLSVIENRKNLLDASISQTEEKGWLISAEYYKALMKTEKENLSQLEKERTALLSALNDAVSSGAIKEYTQAWYDMKDRIDDVTVSIEEANTAVIRYGNSIRDIEWSIFDLLNDRISNITSEADFLIDLMGSDKLYDEDTGKLTDEGMSTMGLHGVDYNIYMAQADQYAEEILKINRQLAEDPYNQELLDKRQELLEQQQEMILAAESEKQAIKDMVEEGIKLELDALKELIDTYTDALDSQKDLYDYQKKVSRQTKEIASLQKQLSAYENDLSEEARAKVQQIRVSLETAKEDLEEMEYEKYIADQKKLLDDLYLEYELILNQRLDNLEALIADMIGEINASADIISTTLSEKAESVGYTLSDSMAGIWDTSTGNITQVLTTYGENINTGISSAVTTVNETLKSINENLRNMISQLNTIADMKIQSVAANTTVTTPSTNGNGNSTGSAANKAGSTSSQPSSASPAKSVSNNPPKVGDAVTFETAPYYSSSDGGGSTGKQLLGQTVYITKINNASWATKPYHIARDKAGARPLGWVALKQLSGYASGKKNIPDDEFAWTQENGGLEAIIRPSDGAVLTPLRKGDSVLNADATDNLFDFANDPVEFLRNNLNLDKPELAVTLPTFTNIAPAAQEGGTVNNHFDMSITLPSVKNYDEFLYKMQHDRSFEKMVQAMTVGQAAGKSSLKKYSVRF